MKKGMDRLIWYRGAVVRINLNPPRSHETAGAARPCVIVSRSEFNLHRDCLTVCPLEGAEHLKRPYPWIVRLDKSEGGLIKDSIVIINQIRTVDKSRYVEYLGQLNEERLKEIERGLRIYLDMELEDDVRIEDLK